MTHRGHGYRPNFGSNAAERDTTPDNIDLYKSTMKLKGCICEFC